MTNNFKKLNVVNPDLFSKLSKDHEILNTFREDPFLDYSMKMRPLIAKILDSKLLTSQQKVSRYLKIMLKLYQLAPYKDDIDKLRGPLDQNPAEMETVTDVQPPKPQEKQWVIDEDEFSGRNISKASSIIKAIRSSWDIKVEPNSLALFVDGQKMLGGNLLDLIHQLLNSLDRKEPTDDIKLILSKLANTTMTGQKINNPKMKKYFMQYRNYNVIARPSESPTEFQLPPEWIPDIRKPKKRRNPRRNVRKST